MRWEQQDEGRKSIGSGHLVVRVPSLSSVSAGRLHLVCFNETLEEAAKLVVRGVRRPVRLEEPEQRLDHTGQNGPQRDDGTLAQKSEINGRNMKHSDASQNSGSNKTHLFVMRRLFL